ncbi:helix-turn-helix domain-containing protein [Streptomyces sp. NPDC005017]|uniref:helix-turn-helix domain-containing protein n=1 Tax=Streptomyces sp. NPDC005017 TaxID=3364706 RepID=UPI0036C86F9B
MQQGVETALLEFAERVTSAGGPLEAARVPVYRALGRGELVEGRSLDALQAAYRLGARIAWRRYARVARRLALGTEAVALLAEAVFTHIDEIAAVSVQAYAEAQADEAGAVGRRRHRLLLLLTSGSPDAEALRQAAADAEWPLPDTVAAVALGRRADQGPSRVMDGRAGPTPSPAVAAGNPGTAPFAGPDASASRDGEAGHERAVGREPAAGREHAAGLERAARATVAARAATAARSAAPEDHGAARAVPSAAADATTEFNWSGVSMGSVEPAETAAAAASVLSAVFPGEGPFPGESGAAGQTSATRAAHAGAALSALRRHRLPGSVLADLESPQPCLVVPTPHLLLADPRLLQLLRETGAVVGPAVPPAQTADSLRWARSLRNAGVAAAPDAPAVTDPSLARLLLLADPALVRLMAHRHLAPLAALTPKQRDRLASTLLACLQTPHSTAPEIAARLGIHPQTARQRLHQVHALFRDALADPDARFEIEAALRATLT